MKRKLRVALCLGLGMGSLATVAHADIGLSLAYVDLGSPAYLRFKGWVDQAVAGSPGYAFSATDAVFMYRLTGQTPYATLAIAMVEAQVTEAEAAIAADQRPEIGGDSYLEVGPMLRDLALVYDWCSPLLTPLQRSRWAAYADQAVWNVWNHENADLGRQPVPLVGLVGRQSGQQLPLQLPAGDDVLGVRRRPPRAGSTSSPT